MVAPARLACAPVQARLNHRNDVGVGSQQRLQLLDVAK